MGLGGEHAEQLLLLSRCWTENDGFLQYFSMLKRIKVRSATFVARCLVLLYCGAA